MVTVALKRGCLRLILKMPFIKSKVSKEIFKVVDGYKLSMTKTTHTPIEDIPTKGWSKAEIVQR